MQQILVSQETGNFHNIPWVLLRVKIEVGSEFIDSNGVGDKRHFRCPKESYFDCMDSKISSEIFTDSQSHYQIKFGIPFINNLAQRLQVPPTELESRQAFTYSVKPVNFQSLHIPHENKFIESAST